MTSQSGLATMTDGCSIAWRIDGPKDAPVLMLSNSLGTSMAMWNDQLPAFSRVFRVLRYDTRGHGSSSVTPGDYSLDRLGRDAVELLGSLDIEKAHFCGLSLGGMTGQWLGIFAPDRLDRLVLANTSSFMGPPSSWQGRMETVRDKGMAAIVDAVLERWYTPAFAATAAPGLARTRQQFLMTYPDGYAGCCAAIRDMDLRPIVGLVKAPTLVIGGSLDPATPPEHAEQIASTISGSRLVWLEAAHLSNIEQPERFTQAVLDFLA